MAASDAFPPLAITPYWQSVQDDIVRMVDLFPEGGMNFTPHESLWNSRGIVIHIADARDQWMFGSVQDGEPYPGIWTTVGSRDDIKRELARTYDRLRRFLARPEALDGTYDDEVDGEIMKRTGHWIAFHLLEHDIHHRTELMQRLALLGVEHGCDL